MSHGPRETTEEPSGPRHAWADGEDQKPQTKAKKATTEKEQKQHCSMCLAKSWFGVFNQGFSVRCPFFFAWSPSSCCF